MCMFHFLFGQRHPVISCSPPAKLTQTDWRVGNMNECYTNKCKDDCLAGNRWLPGWKSSEQSLSVTKGGGGRRGTYGMKRGRVV